MDLCAKASKKKNKLNVLVLSTSSPTEGEKYFNTRCKRGLFVFQVHFSYGGADGTTRNFRM